MGRFAEETPVLMEPDEELIEFRWRLAETIAWCAERASAADARSTLRTPALRPLHLLTTRAESSEPPPRRVEDEEWAVCQLGPARARLQEKARQAILAERDRDIRIAEERQVIVRALADERAKLLRAENRYPSMPAGDLAGGRLLLMQGDFTVWDGVSELESEGFFDGDDIPPWDTWICYLRGAATFDEAALSHMPARRLREFGRCWISYLVSWVPPQLIQLVDAGIEINPVDCIFWAADYRSAPDLDTPFWRGLDAAGLLA